MDELPDSVMEWNSSGSSCSELSKFLACVYDLAYDEKPKYEVLKKILLDGLESSGTRYDGPLEFSTAGCGRNRTAEASKVCLPKPVPKPVQQKQKKTEGEEYMRPNKACTAVTGRRLPDEEKPSNLHRMLPQPEPQQVHLPKPSRKPVQKKQIKMKEEDSNYPSRPQARITRRQFQAEEKPIKLNSTIQEPDPEKKDTGRELPPLYPQATFSEFKKNNQDQLFTTDHPVSLQEPGLSVSTIFRLAFTEERYHYSIAILALLFLIWLSLSFT